MVLTTFIYVIKGTFLNIVISEILCIFVKLNIMLLD